MKKQKKDVGNLPKMNQDFFSNLSSEIFISILSRLPIRTICSCKCVCKSWLDLIQTKEFANVHLSNSVSALLVLESNEQSKFHKILEFEDEFDLERHELHYNPVTTFNLPYHGEIYGSVNGLLFMCDKDLKPEGLYICNPITRDYVKLCCPQEFVSYKQLVTYGFGLSEITGQYKVVRISQECNQVNTEPPIVSHPECRVYTLGTGSWRRVASRATFNLSGIPNLKSALRYAGAFVNGNVYWLAIGADNIPCISYFDLETETFSTLMAPISIPESGLRAALCVLENILCLCECKSNGEIVVWLLMKCCGKQSWIDGTVIDITPEFSPFVSVDGIVFPHKFFKDGDVLLERVGSRLFYYTNTNETEPFDVFHDWHEGIIHTPSFLSLKFFEMENVRSF